jgi:spore cortex biosynthesis protein YabQ
VEPVSGLGTELRLFGQFFLLGAVMVVVYDLLRVLRRMFRHGIIWISLEDFLYWIVGGGLFFLYLCRDNNGIIRGYIILAMVLGACGYYGLCSRPLMHRMEKIIISVKKRLKKVQKAATMGVKRLQNKGEPKEAENNDESRTKKTP